MAKNKTMSHYGSGNSSDWSGIIFHHKKSTFKERILNNGYQNWNNIGENIAVGQKTLDSVMDAWIKSDHHCANIMSSNFSDVGMAVIIGSDNKKYWTQNFGNKI